MALNTVWIEEQYGELLKGILTLAPTFSRANRIFM